MEEGGVEIGLNPAWYHPAGDLVSNDEVAAYLHQPARVVNLQTWLAPVSISSAVVVAHRVDEHVSPRSRAPSEVFGTVRR